MKAFVCSLTFNGNVSVIKYKTALIDLNDIHLCEVNNPVNTRFKVKVNL